jgi:hypothetical protein
MGWYPVAVVILHVYRMLPYQKPVNISVLYVDAITLSTLSFCFDYLNNTR